MWMSHAQILCKEINMKKTINNDKTLKDMVVGNVVAHLICPTLIIKELKFSVDHDSVTTL